MAEVLMCDCCENIYEVDVMNITEEYVVDDYGEESIATDHVCDWCIELMKRRGAKFKSIQHACYLSE